jgi:hypothetical protein
MCCPAIAPGFRPANAGMQSGKLRALKKISYD